jgi:hypothetical protein
MQLGRMARSMHNYVIKQHAKRGLQVGTKVTVDSPALITRDSETKHILVGDETGFCQQAYAELLAAPSFYSCVETKCIAIGDP